METLIIYESIHHRNTEKVVEEVGEVLGCETVRAEEVEIEDVERYSTVGLASGIYFGKMHRNIGKLLDNIEGKDVFIIVTSGFRSLPLVNPFKKRIEKKVEENNRLLGLFSCRGFDTYGILERFGGIYREHPDRKDLERVREFGKRLKQTT